MYAAFLSVRGQLNTVLHSFLPGNEKSAVLNVVDDAAMLERRQVCFGGQCK